MFGLDDFIARVSVPEMRHEERIILISYYVHLQRDYERQLRILADVDVIPKDLIVLCHKYAQKRIAPLYGVSLEEVDSLHEKG